MSVPLGRLILAGGGGAEDSLPLDQLFASWVGDGKLLYLPIAMDGISPTYSECLNWLNSAFNPLGITDINLCTDVYALDDQQLASAKGIYIGGGNTYHLLHLFRESGLADRLVRYVQNGGSVYGGSAGAIIWGHDISTSQYADPNEVGLQDMCGFDWLRGYSLWCHYVPQHDVTIQTFLQQNNIPLLALSERSGLLVENGTITAIGYEPVVCFNNEVRTLLNIGDTLPLA